MRIDELLKISEPLFSFEFFPPKTDAGVENLFSTVATLRALEPSFVSITWGAGGSTRARTLELVSRIKRELHIEAMAHLTCVGATREELGEILARFHAEGVENVLCLRGDPPQGEERFEHTQGGFAYASELTQFANEGGRFCLGVAGYPEGHPESADRFADLVHLKAKVDAGARFVVTQLFFDNAYYFEFVAQARRMGIDVPIVPGIMPIGSVEQVERITQMCGATIPERLRRELLSRRDDPKAAHELGVAFATLQCAELLRQGAPGIHFYTLNKSSATRAILAALRTSQPWRR